MDPAMDAVTYGLYLHVPFCARRCAYCDFFSTEEKLRLLPSYVRALSREAEQVGAAGRSPVVGSVYFGGGTPSLLGPDQVGTLLGKIRSAFTVETDAEITLEANPGTLDGGRLRGFREAGVNRLSLGVQSMVDDELRLLGRIHTSDMAERTFREARRSGWETISLDLIFGLPGQTVDVWVRTLAQAMDLAPEHLSLYSLTLERGTELARAVRRGALPAPEEDASAEMYERAEEMLAGAGYRHYEISNWARDDADNASAGRGNLSAGKYPKYSCRHNLRYWLNLPYLGFGAGAHGCAGGKRYATIRSVEKYIARLRNGWSRRFPLTTAVSRSVVRTRDDEMRETMWLGLRLTETGVDRGGFRRRFDEDYYDRFRVEIESAIAEGLLEQTPPENSLRLTPRGRLLGNRVFRLFV
jgi:oxygen-independent coproporphyrinogen-3 oxidase